MHLRRPSPCRCEICSTGYEIVLLGSKWAIRATSSASRSTLRLMPSSSRSTKRAKSKPSTVPRQDYRSSRGLPER
jgi:hypothetical protein